MNNSSEPKKGYIALINMSYDKSDIIYILLGNSTQKFLWIDDVIIAECPGTREKANQS